MVGIGTKAITAVLPQFCGMFTEIFLNNTVIILVSKKCLK